MEISLRPIKFSDSENIVKWRNNPDVKKNLYSQDNITINQQHDYFHKFIETKKIYQFVIIADGVECGTTFLKNIDTVNKSAEFGIFIGEESYRGKGIGTVATQKTIKLGFEELCLRSINLTVFSDNLGAIRSYEKAGFVVARNDIERILGNGNIVSVTEMIINNL